MRWLRLGACDGGVLLGLGLVVVAGWRTEWGGDDAVVPIEDDVLDLAIEAFHTALDRHVDDFIHGRAGDWVDGSAEAIVEASLWDGWMIPDLA